MKNKLKLTTLSVVIPVILTAITGSVSAHEKHHNARSIDFERPLDVVSLPNGTELQFSDGVGSSAFHFPGDNKRQMYTASDRGVNIKCKDDLEIMGVDVCVDGKIFPVPGFSPSIYQFEFSPRRGWQVIRAIKLKDTDGQPISGLPNPLQVTDTELAFDLLGNPIELDPEGVDTEALIKLTDGSFWLGEEYGPSLLHVAATGEVLQRLTPATVDADLIAANYPVLGVLPEILKKRKLNRGIESLAVSPDEQYLYFAMQSPLANPSVAAYKQSRNVRVFKLERASMSVVGEWLYRLDTANTFLDDTNKKQKDVKVSEMVAVDKDDLIILERVSKTTKLYRVTLDEADNIFGTVWDALETSPSLEETSDPATAGITALNKELVLDSAVDYPGLFPSKVEGIAVMNENTLILVNDNDFGIKGDKTTFLRLHKPLHLK